MTDCKFEAGKTYQLRGSGTAEILKGGVKLRVSGSIILGLINEPDGYQSLCGWHLDGRASKDGETDLDIMPLEPKRESLWINIYPSELQKGPSLPLHKSKEIADSAWTRAHRTHVLELVYEDGVFVKSITHKV